MITVIRKQIKTKLFQVIVWFFIVLFGIFFVLPNILDREPTPEWLVAVNGQNIYYPAFARAVSKQELNIQMIRQQYGAYADMFIQMLGLNQDPKVLAFDQIVREEILNTVAQNIPLHIHENYIERVLNDPHFAQHAGLFDVLPLGIFTQHGLDQQALRFYLSRNKLNMKQFEDLIQQALARHTVVELSSLAAYVPAYMQRDAINSELSKRKYTILTFPFDAIKEKEKTKEVSLDELSSFFEKQNRDLKRYSVPEMRAADVWELTPAGYGIVVSDDAVQEYYEKNRIKKYVSEPAKIQVRHILFKKSETEPKELLAKRALLLHQELVKDPGLFEAKAREYSDDKESAQQGGLLPLFAKGDKDAVFERKAFTLKQNGDISEVFEMPEGYEIIQRVDKKATVFKPLQEVKNEIHDLLLHQLFAQKLNQDMKKLLDPTNIDEHALADFLKEKKGKLIKQELAANDNSKRMQAMFKLKEGKADFYIENNNGYIVQVTKIQKKYIPNLDTIQEVVKNDLIQERSERALTEQVKEALQAIKEKNKSIADIAKQFGASIKEIGPIQRNDEDALKKLQEEGIPIQKMLQVEKIGDALAHMQHNGYIFYVSDVVEPSVEEYDQKKSEISTRLDNEIKGLFMQGFVASLSRNAKIEVNESLLTQIETQTL